MQVVILAGWLGTRLSGKTIGIPKPMVTAGGDPILLQLKEFLDNEFSYRDGHSNIDLGSPLAHHKRVGKIGTVTAIRPPVRAIFKEDTHSHIQESGK